MAECGHTEPQRCFEFYRTACEQVFFRAIGLHFCNNLYRCEGELITKAKLGNGLLSPPL